MSKPLSRLNLSKVRPESLAVLLDLDGTLVAIADRPEDVVLDDRTMRALLQLRSALGGAVAIISGRPVREIERLLSPSKFAVAGSHGLERRDHSGNYSRGDFNRGALDGILDAFEADFVDEDGIVVEPKPGSVALHYRQRPDLAARCCAAAAKLVASRTDARLLRGKMVVEVQLGSQTKADAVREFMAVEPFRGRIPVYAGDDVTDEDAFRAVREFGGIAIKVGAGETTADYRVSGTQTFLSWLYSLSVKLGGDGQIHDQGELLR